VNPATDPYSGYAAQIVQAITAWAIKDALWGISNLMHSFGDATEPDFVALVPIYNRRARDRAARSGRRIARAERGEDLSLVARGGDQVIPTLFQYEWGDAESVGRD